jgi:TonB-linked SusC/RagA family outer membrane protein
MKKHTYLTSRLRAFAPSRLRAFALVCALPLASFAQQTISGIVSDENGLPLPGATVIVENSNRGTTTDFDGKYLISALGGENLVFSYVGYIDQKITIDNIFNINVNLQPEGQLSEVVVTGFQKIDRKLFTGSADKVDMADAKLEGVADLSRALQGQVAGVDIENVSGTFGTAPQVRIRGNASINGTNRPLWVVDGVVLEDAVEISNEDIASGDLNTILSSSTAGLNAEDVESFEILRDASATSLYGARAINGVIVITSKRGVAGKTRFNFSSEATLRSKPSYSQFDILDSGEEMSIYYELYQKDFIDLASVVTNRHHGALSDHLYRKGLKELPPSPQNIPDWKLLERNWNANTDWFDLLFKNDIVTRNSFSVSGGSENITVRASLGILYDPGQTIVDEVDNYTADFTADFDLSSKSKLGFNFRANIRDQRIASSEDREFNAVRGVFERNFDINPFNYALYTSRSITAYDENGELQFFRRNWAPFNIFHESAHNFVDIDLSDLSAQLRFDYNFSENFNFSTTFQSRWFTSNAVQKVHENANQAESYRADDPLLREVNIFLFDDFENPLLEPYSVLPNGGFRHVTTNTLVSHYIRSTLEYSNTFNENHLVTLFAGQEVRVNDRERVYSEGWGYLYDKGGLILADPNFLRYLDANGDDYYSVTPTKNRSWGVFLNAAYSYKGKYIFNGTFRYDGDNRTGKSRSARYLPTWNVSGAWNVHNEKFLNNVSWINSVRLKSTYGLSGGNPLDASAGLIIRGEEPLRRHLSDRETALLIAQLENNELTFEKLYEWNIGLELGLFNNRVFFEAEYYKRRSEDLLGTVSTNAVGGDSIKFGNIGELESDGVELTLETTNIRTDSFTWSSSFNISLSDNTITEYDSNERVEDMTSRSGGHIVGYPRGALFSIPFAGLNSDGIPTFFDDKGERVVHVNLQNRENILDYLKYEGPVTPTTFGGFNNTFNYKNLRLIMGISFRAGNKIRLDDFYRDGAFNDYRALPGDLRNRWILPGDEERTNVPSISTIRQRESYESSGLFNPNDLYNRSDVRVADGDFIRVRNIRLSYTLPKSILPADVIENMSLTLSAHNLWLIYSDKKLRGVDPEFHQVGGISLPLTRTYTMSFTINF